MGVWLPDIKDVFGEIKKYKEKYKGKLEEKINSEIIEGDGSSPKPIINYKGSKMLYRPSN